MKKIRIAAYFAMTAVLLGPSINFPLTGVQLSNKVGSSVFYLMATEESGKGAEGSAVAVTSEILATNCHVLEKAKYIKVKVNENYLSAYFLSGSEEHDLCFLKVPEAAFNPVQLRSTHTVSVGEDVYAAGYALGLQRSLSKGIISKMIASNGGFIIQTDAAISPGSSGGGLFDQQGHLIGITTFKLVHGENMNIAIPSDWIIQRLTALNAKLLLSHHEKLFVQQPAQTKAEFDFHNTIKTPLKEASPLKDSETILNLVKHGFYGKASVSLYQLNNECFFYMLGRDLEGKPKNSAVYYPKTNSLFFFPEIYTGRIAIALLYFEIQSNTAEEVLTNSELFLNDHIFVLNGLKTNRNEISIYYVRFNKSLLPLFRNNLNFKVVYQDKNAKSITYYSLDGFKQAHQAYLHYCH